MGCLKFNFKKRIVITVISFIAVITIIIAVVVYGINSNRFGKMISNKNQIILKQTSNVINIIFEEIDKLAIQYSLRQDVNYFSNKIMITSANDYIEASKLLRDMRSINTVNPVVASIEIVYPNTHIIFKNSNYVLDELEILNLDDAKYYYNLIESSRNYNIESRIINIDGTGVNKTVLSVTRYFGKSTFNGFYIIVNIDQNAFLNLIQQINPDDTESQFILMWEGELLLSNLENPALYLQHSDIRMDNINHNGKVYIEKTNYYMSYFLIPYNNLQYMLFSNINSISNQIRVVNYDIFKTIVIILLIFILLGKLASDKLYLPIYNLLSDVRNLSLSRDELSDESLDEIGFIKDRIKGLVIEKQNAMAILKQNMPIIKRNFTIRLIKGNVVKEQIKEKLSLYQIKLDKECFGILLIKIEGNCYNQQNEFASEGISNLIQHRLDSLLEEFDDGFYKHCLVEVEEGLFSIILNYNESTDELRNRFLMCQKLKDIILKEFEVILTFASGKQVMNIQEIYESFSSAEVAMERRYIFGKGEIILYSHSFEEQQERLTYPWELEKHLVHAVKNSDVEKMNNVLYTIFKPWIKWQNSSQRELQFVIAQLGFSIIKEVLKSESFEDALIAELYQHILSSITDERGLEDYALCLEELCQKLINFRQIKIEQRNLELIQRVKDFIEKHYAEDISVEDIANNVYLSPAHLGRIFKCETGKTLVEYLTERKIFYAIELLAHSDENISEIAQKVGYTNSKSFSRAFKAYTGKTPSQYRETMV